MYDELKFFGLAPLFGVLGALSTVVAWHLFAVLMIDAVPDQLQVLSCLIVGLVGPVVVWLTVWVMTRIRAKDFSAVIRRSASVGLGLVLAAQVGFYVPLGFFAIAFA
jgi:predicted membrane-bound spermidine synthase